MIVKIIETGKERNVPDAYGARLIEQGQATPVKEAPRPKRKGEKKNGSGNENP